MSCDECREKWQAIFCARRSIEARRGTALLAAQAGFAIALLVLCAGCATTGSQSPEVADAMHVPADPGPHQPPPSEGWNGVLVGLLRMFAHQ